MKTVIVVGAGIAGLSAALSLSKQKDVSVILMSAQNNEDECSSWYAQGGIVTIPLHDSVQSLVQDIQNASDNTSNPTAALFLATHARQDIQDILIDQAQICFDSEYAKEAAHATSRVMHCKDHTGKTIMQGLRALIKTIKNISIWDHWFAIDLIKQENSCIGIVAFDKKTQNIFNVYAAQTILATGGIGQIYSMTSNPFSAVGSGLAMAYRAGVSLSHIEFVQFHPTVLALEQIPQKMLITEAMRGAGALLKNKNYESFMHLYNKEWKDLAPRDEVSRALFSEMEKSSSKSVYLDIASVLSASEIIEKFPSIYAYCKKFGIDITKQMIPVTPAAHYHCGGIGVDTTGATSLEGLYAVGEVSSTGVHGSNRLASTSLLEGLIWGTHVGYAPQNICFATEKHTKKTIFTFSDMQIDKMSLDIQTIMWEKVGVIRSKKSLKKAVVRLKEIMEISEHIFQNHAFSISSLRLRNMSTTAYLVAKAAYENPHSSGCHYIVS